MRKRYGILVMMLVLALVAAACGSDGDDEDTTTTAASGGDETTTTADSGGTETTTTASGGEGEAADVVTDFGVDLDGGTITVGLLSDLSGPFAGLVAPVVAGQEAYWEYVNANGGIEGLQVELEVRDTGYDPPTHVTLYEEIKDEVVALGHSTGTPQTLAVWEDMIADGMLALPLTWYSGWTSPFDSNTLHHGAPYCIEAMNAIEYVINDTGAQTIAIASVPGDYGLDSAAGAVLAAEGLGLEIVYDGAGKIIPGEDLAPIGVAIAESGADLAFVTATPTTFPSIYGAALAQGYEAAWSGASVTYNSAYLLSDLAGPIERDWYNAAYYRPWSFDSEGNQLARELAEAAGIVPNDYFLEGIIEGIMMEQVLRTAYASGDMTRAGVLAAAKSIESLDLLGLAPNEQYTGTPDEQLQRVSTIQRPSLADLEAGGSGSIVLDAEYTSDLAANFTFESACFEL